jgi:hypothetical protein
MATPHLLWVFMQKFTTRINDLCEFCAITDGSAPKQPRSTTIGKTQLEILHSKWDHLDGFVNGALVEYDQVKDKYMRL